MKLLIWLLSISIMVGGCGGMQNKPAVSKYPDKPITMIVPFSVGGSIDLTARELEKKSIQYLGQPLLVINKPGGAGTIGWNELAIASPDGYTLGLISTEYALHPLYGQVNYHYPTALEPLAQISSSPPVLVVRNNQPWETLSELVSYAKNHPGEIKFAHGGVGSVLHVIGEMFGQAAGIRLEQVPFRGGGEITAALLGGHVQMAILGPGPIKEHIKNGTLRALAVSGETRLSDPLFGNIPTFKEQGWEVACSYWVGIGAPKGLPAEVKAKLSVGLKEMINDPQFKLNQEKLGLQPDYLDPQAAAVKWLEEGERFAAVVKETGIVDLIKAQKK